jgi:hypothetical protein
VRAASDLVVEHGGRATVVAVALVPDREEVRGTIRVSPARPGHRLRDGGCVLLVTLFGDRRSEEIVLGLEVGLEGVVGPLRVDVMSVEPRELSMPSRPTPLGRSRH